MWVSESAKQLCEFRAFTPPCLQPCCAVSFDGTVCVWEPDPPGEEEALADEAAAKTAAAAAGGAGQQGGRRSGPRARRLSVPVPGGDQLNDYW